MSPTLARLCPGCRLARITRARDAARRAIPPLASGVRSHRGTLEDLTRRAAPSG
jgi:hypothetical protein